VQEASAVSLLEEILTDALAGNCSDVHLHLSGDELVVQFRSAGQLAFHRVIKNKGGVILRRVKAIAKMDVADARLPQDGAFVWDWKGLACDVRAAAIPTIQGESVVLRLLPRVENRSAFADLGMSPSQAAEVEKILSSGSGLVLVAGSTGSGKTTTLYTMMLWLAAAGRNVVSIEDPVEMPVPSCHQMQVREQVGVTFDVGLKALLRQDPDVIMIGEIRDEETARVALRAALSGHLVLSTTHARDLVGASARLVDFGLSRGLLGDVLRAVLVQELVLVPCSNCSGDGCAQCLGREASTPRVGSFSIHMVDGRKAALLSSECNWAQLRTEFDLNPPSIAEDLR